MAPIPTKPPHADPTTDAMREIAVALIKADEQPRRYLGMSSIGEKCERKLWYSFRWSFTVSPWLAQDEKLKLVGTWAADDGHRAEEVFASRLRKVPGVELHTLDPRTGKQIEFSYLGGHFCGHMDGAILGVLQAPKTWHVWEHKAKDEKFTNSLQKSLEEKGEKGALQEWDAIYYAQAVMYMDSGEFTRHYMTVSGPGARLPAIGLRTNANPVYARTLHAKAERIIKSATPPPRINENAAWHECRICPAWEACHGKKAPPVSCRTCIHSTPELDGNARWSCKFHGIDIPEHGQRIGCDSHRYIPELLPFAKPVDASLEGNWIKYAIGPGEIFTNGDAGPGSFTSDEIFAAEPWQLTDDNIATLRAEFAAKIVPAEEPAPF